MSDVTILLRENYRNDAHVGIGVWVGRDPGSRGNAGELTLRSDEWDEICDQNGQGPTAFVPFTSLLLRGVQFDSPAWEQRCIDAGTARRTVDGGIEAAPEEDD